MAYEGSSEFLDHRPAVPNEERIGEKTSASAVHWAISELCDAVAAEIDLDACGLRLSRALHAARCLLETPSRVRDPE